jgi:succinate dehydrogenase/fumarate reductase flavoprotein subunit
MTFDKVVDMHHSGAGRPGIGLTFSGNEHSRAIMAVSKPAPRGHVPSPEGTGLGFFRPIKAKAEELGCEILYETTGDMLYQDDTGRVIGVRATDASGSSINIQASKGVVLTAGGFTMNERMVADNWVYSSTFGFAVANPNELGIGIKMGIGAGADTFGMSNHQIGATTYGVHPDFPKGLIINQAGRRIIAEDAYGSFAGEKVMQNDGAYFLVDDALQQILSADGGFEPLASAQTVEELAANFGIPGSTLANTLSYYNESIASGEDVELGKTEEYLVPLTTPPYYLHYFGPQATYFMTSGGLRINLDAQVIDREGSPIPSLYAAGRNSGITFGHYMASGSSVLDCLTFGRIAGQKVAAEASA